MHSFFILRELYNATIVDKTAHIAKPNFLNQRPMDGHLRMIYQTYQRESDDPARDVVTGIASAHRHQDPVM